MMFMVVIMVIVVVVRALGVVMLMVLMVAFGDMLSAVLVSYVLDFRMEISLHVS